MYAYHNNPERLSRTNLNIVLDNVTLDNVDSEKLLGVILDRLLTSKHNVNKTTKTVSITIALRHRIKRYICPTKPVYPFIRPTFNPT